VCLRVGGLVIYVQGFVPGQVPAAASANGRSPQRATRSLAGGATARNWYYISLDDTMMAVPVKSTATTFEPGAAVALFQTDTRGFFFYDVAADGRFLIDTGTVGGTADSSPITVVLNWTAGLQK
jgi:hypothetical protein